MMKKKLRKKIIGADSAKGEIKCIREKIESEGENQGLPEEIKGTKAKAEKSLRGEYKVQNVPKGKIKSEGEKPRIMEENLKAFKQRRKIKGDGGKQMVQIVLRGQIKSMRVEITCEGGTLKDYECKLQGRKQRRKTKD